MPVANAATAGHERRRRQIGANHRSEQDHEQLLTAERDRATDHACADAQHDELQREQAPGSCVRPRRGSASSPPHRDGAGDSATPPSRLRRRRGSRRPARRVRGIAPRVRASAAPRDAGRGSTRCAVRARAAPWPSRGTRRCPTPATSSRHVARFPGCRSRVAATSSMFISSFGPSVNNPPVTSGSCCTIAATVNVVSPTASLAPSLHVEPRGEPRVDPRLARRRDAARDAARGVGAASASVIAPRSG